MDHQITGVLTFLFTDIEGSVGLWEHDRSRMASLTADHRKIVADAVAGQGGALVREKGEGDSTFSVFTRPGAAARAVVAMQVGLFEHPWPPDMPVRVRAGLHSGTAYHDPDEGPSDFNSPTVNRCARIRSLAHGGQTLLSEAYYQLLCDEWPDAPTLDLGAHALRGMGRPERVYQLLCPPPVPPTFPPLASPGAPRHNLPAPLTCFVGRVPEKESVRRLLAEARLVTLTGLGGAGKTRLAQEAARDLLDKARDLFPDGVWHADLEGEPDPAEAVAAALAAPAVPGRTAAERLTAFLAARRCLLLLDGGPRSPVRDLAEILLRRCPGVTLLVTAHAPLGVSGERPLALGPLSLPAEGETAPHAVAGCDAPALFAERARDAAHDFALTARTAPDVAAVCRRLDGLPLALELAAACLPSLGLAPLARRLAAPAAGLDVLWLVDKAAHSEEQPDVPPRRTLVGALDLSYGQLEGDDRALLARLASFAGGWTLEAAEAVCGGPEVVAGTARLVRRALVVKEEREGLVRYRLPGLVALYARHRAEEAGLAAEADRRHRDHYAALAARAAASLSGDGAGDWLDELEGERANLLAALGRFGPGEAAVGLNAAARLYPFWSQRGLAAEGRAALTRLLSLTAEGAAGPEAEAAARALAARGALAWSVGDYPAARADHTACRDARAALDDRRGVADADNNLGTIAWDEGDFAGARARFEAALSVLEELGDQEGVAAACGNLAGLAADEGDLDRAEALLERALASDRARKDLWAVATSLDALGGVVLRRGGGPRARVLRDEALKLRRQSRDRPGLAESLEGLAVLHAPVRPALAALLLGSAERLRETLECPLPPRSRAERRRLVAELRAALPETYDDSWRRGCEMDWEQAAHAALSADEEGAGEPQAGQVGAAAGP